MAPPAPKIKSKTAAGKGCLTIFLLLFLLIGLLLTGMFARKMYETALTYTWSRVPSEIVSSEGRVNPAAEDEGSPYLFEVSYRYTWQGQPHESRSRSLGKSSFSDWNDVQRLLKKYPAGEQAYCYVNPSDAAQAILERESLWPALLLGFPMIFVFIGGGGIYLLWFYRDTTSVSRSISGRATKRAKGWVMAAVFATFVILGGGVFAGFFLRPAMMALDAPNWEETPCEVIFSRVGRHSDSDGATYSVDILFSYRVDGTEYRSSRYRFVNFSSSGYSSKRSVVEKHPPGTRAVCYVNPRNPEEAVMDRRISATLLVGLIPAGLFAVGLAGLVYTVPRMRRTREPEAMTARLPHAAEPLVLRPSVGSFGRLTGTAVFALFWNGVIAVFIWQAIAGWRSGSPSWFLMLFLVPFTLVGIASIGAVGYYFLALFSPKPEIMLTPGSVPLGGSATVDWRIRHGVRSIERLQIYLEGREEATYTRGTDTVTDKHTFARIDMAELLPPAAMTRGTAGFSIPRDSMHSFESRHNKVIWALHVKGDVRWWPDINEEFGISVRPVHTW